MKDELSRIFTCVYVTCHASQEAKNRFALFLHSDEYLGYSGKIQALFRC